ncbi:MAG TPA: hypothetical protein VFW15_00650, partial [Thermoanaerobaculia bacterium]|nr:hypothetical protein [Thermoanaerobaculia bacterium]
ARTSFGSVKIDGVRESVDVVNQNGSVEVSAVPAGCARLTLKTSFAPLRVYLPESAGYTVSARTSFGKINSEIPVASGSARGESLSGKIGDGRCELTLNNSNGNIELLKGTGRR